jgi:hypothetical protein
MAPAGAEQNNGTKEKGKNVATRNPNLLSNASVACAPGTDRRPSSPGPSPRLPRGWDDPFLGCVKRLTFSDVPKV